MNSEPRKKGRATRKEILDLIEDGEKIPRDPWWDKRREAVQAQVNRIGHLDKYVKINSERYPVKLQIIRHFPTAHLTGRNRIGDVIDIPHATIEYLTKDDAKRFLEKQDMYHKFVPVEYERDTATLIDRKLFASDFNHTEFSMENMLKDHVEKYYVRANAEDNVRGLTYNKDFEEEIPFRQLHHYTFQRHNLRYPSIGTYMIDLGENDNFSGSYRIFKSSRDHIPGRPLPKYVEKISRDEDESKPSQNEIQMF